MLTDDIRREAERRAAARFDDFNRELKEHGLSSEEELVEYFGGQDSEEEEEKSR